MSLTTNSDVEMDEVKLKYKIVPKGTKADDAKKIPLQEISGAFATALGTLNKKGTFSKKKLKKGDIVRFLGAKATDAIHYEVAIKKGNIENKVEKSFTVKSQFLEASKKNCF